MAAKKSREETVSPVVNEEKKLTVTDARNETVNVSVSEVESESSIETVTEKANEPPELSAIEGESELNEMNVTQSKSEKSIQIVANELVKVAGGSSVQELKAKIAELYPGDRLGGELFLKELHRLRDAAEVALTAGREMQFGLER